MLAISAAGYFFLHSAAGTETKGGDEEITAREAARYDTSTTDWDDYLWPTNAGTRRTSDFAEFRATHFHAGIDVSTGGQTGFDVYASRDGWLHSAYFEPGGYGWFLVLRHPDGYYTCYAHLDRFSDRVAQAYYGRLLRMNHSYGYLSFTRGDTVRVKKGEVIAYTGATGAGPAHLHFEVRDPDFNPVNPGLSRNLRPVDSIPPEMRQLILQPLDASSSVDGRFAPGLYNVRGEGDSWRIGDTPVLRGRVGVQLRAHDRANGATDYPTPYRIAMYVDGKEVFSATSNRFQDSLGFHIRIDRDHELMKAKKGEFRKLYREAGNLLETYWPRDAEAGVLSAARFGAGEKKLLIVAQDLAGHRSLLTMTVMLAADLTLEHHMDAALLSLRAKGDGAMLLLEEKGKRGWEAVHQWPWKEAEAGIAVDLKRYRGSSIRVVGVDSHGNRDEHATWTPGGSRTAARLYPKRQVIDDQIVYDLKTAVPFAAPPQVSLVQGERMQEGAVFPVAENEYRAVLTAWPGFAGKGTVHVRYRMGERDIDWTDEIEATLISATQGGQLRSADGRFVMSFAPGDLHRSMLLTVQPAGGDSVRSYLAGPEGAIVAGRPLVSIIPDAGMTRPVVTVAWPVKKYADLKLPNSVGAAVGRYLGTYTLADDTEGPRVQVQAALRSREAVRVSITDDISGVDWNSIEARIDGAMVPLVYDERRNLLVLPYDVFKEIGRGVFSVKARDKAGNESVVKRKL